MSNPHLRIKSTDLPKFGQFHNILPRTMTLYEPKISIVVIPADTNTLYVHSDHEDAQVKITFLSPENIKKTFDCRFRYGRTSVDLTTAIRNLEQPIFLETFPKLQNESENDSNARVKMFVIHNDRENKIVSVLIHGPLSRSYNIDLSNTAQAFFSPQ
jgi:hypothetical protein